MEYLKGNYHRKISRPHLSILSLCSKFVLHNMPHNRSGVLNRAMVQLIISTFPEDLIYYQPYNLPHKFQFFNLQTISPTIVNVHRVKSLHHLKWLAFQIWMVLKKGMSKPRKLSNLYIAKLNFRCHLPMTIKMIIKWTSQGDGKVARLSSIVNTLTKNITQR